MKTFGISAVLMTVLSFLLWLAGWSYWNFFLGKADNSIDYVMRAVSFLATLTQYSAILLISIGVVLAAGRLSKN